MNKKKHIKKRRQQPAPKKKKKVAGSYRQKEVSLEDKLKAYGMQMAEAFKDKDSIKNAIASHIERIDGYFRKYDSIQLIGSVGLYTIDNLPTLEKKFMAQYTGQKLRLDEEAEVLAEYALNFGLSMPNDGKENPTDEVVTDLRETLKALFHLYRMLDMPLENDTEKFLDWMIHSETIAVRGDGYQEHILEVFNEMFEPHTSFYEQRFGFSIKNLVDFLNVLEDRVICKIGGQNMIYGPFKMWTRWKEWDERTYGKCDDIEDFGKRDFSKGIMSDFFEANPDVPHTEDGQKYLCYQPDDYSGSDKIFWVWPQNEVEKNIMSALSVEFGDNASFIAEGEYKGNILNGHSIYEKPFVKVEDKYYCFTPMIPHRNMFLIAEKLMKSDTAYYNNYFQQNTTSNSRDNYIERKVKAVLHSFLPSVVFYPSVNYSIVEDGVGKTPELDILGVSDKAVYIIEVKAHELSHKDRVGIRGAKEKFKASVAEACYQCQRAARFIAENSAPSFGSGSGAVAIDKSKPVYKIAVAFQHYSTMIGYMDMLVGAGLLDDSYRDTWIVSLFDLMVCADFIESEDEFIEYLELHKTLYLNHSTFNDELDVLNGFLNEDLARKVKPGKPIMLVGGAEEIDKEYYQNMEIPMAKA